LQVNDVSTTEQRLHSGSKNTSNRELKGPIERPEGRNSSIRSTLRHSFDQKVLPVINGSLEVSADELEQFLWPSKAGRDRNLL
jgi:hypothetical protein